MEHELASFVVHPACHGVSHTRDAPTRSTQNGCMDDTGGLVIGRAMVKTGGGVLPGRSNAVDPTQVGVGVWGCDTVCTACLSFCFGPVA